ncbi:MAG: permease prefix domain 1-containing protein [Mycobacteriales bacterium]
MSDPDGPIESYLDDLLARLDGRPRDVRRALHEAEDHLYAHADAAVRAGADPGDAEADAVARFGPPATVARSLNAALPLTARHGLIRTLAVQLTALAGVGLVAIGISGLVEALLARIWGEASVVADPPGTRYSATACHYWESLHPHAATCAQAYVAESMADGLFQRYAAGILGLAVLLVWIAVRRRLRRPVVRPLTDMVPAVLGAAAFCVAAVIFAGLAVHRLRLASGDGAGQWLSAAAVATIVGIGYAALSLRSVRDARETRRVAS